MQRGSARRAFLTASGVIAGGLLAARLVRGWEARNHDHHSEVPTSEGTIDDSEQAAWEMAEQLRGIIRVPDFPEQSFLITDYGATGDGQTDCTDALAAAIEACTTAGGGRVVVPAGTFLTGPVHLRSNVNLHLERQATLRFIQDPAAYLPAVFTRWQGIELFNYSPFIYAFEQENVALTGGGILDGQAGANHWWPWMSTRVPNQHADWTLLQQMAAQELPVGQRIFGAGHYLRPNFIQFYRCRNVLIEGVTIINSPMWAIHPVLSENVVVRGVTVVSHGPNNDGCDPESCSNVLIQGCTFDTADDCIAIKAGRDADGRRVNIPSENILIEDCVFRNGAAGLAIGSEISGGVRAVFAQNIRMLSRHLLHCLHIKTNAYRGGIIEQIFVRNSSANRVVAGAIEINFGFGHYEEGTRGNFLPVVRDIYVRNLSVEAATHALSLRGHPESPIQRLRVTDSTFKSVTKPNVLKYVEDIRLRNVFIAEGV
jgi:polygalacturonase